MFDIIKFYITKKKNSWQKQLIRSDLQRRKKICLSYLEKLLFINSTKENEKKKANRRRRRKVLKERSLKQKQKRKKTLLQRKEFKKNRICIKEL